MHLKQFGERLNSKTIDSISFWIKKIILHNAFEILLA